MSFSTLNESQLHKTLKTLYSELYEGQTEVEKNGYVYDIITKNGNVIEIQTKNLSKLLPKIQDTIKENHKIKIVHPIIINRQIKTYDKNRQLVSNRKSPKRGHILDLFSEITGIYSILLNPKFSLEIVEISMIEERVKTETPVQTQNKKRRFKRDWIKTGKRLDQIINTRRFNKKEDYLSLLPPLETNEFCAKDLRIALEKDKNIPSRIYKNPNLIIWVLYHMEILEYTKTEKRSKYYKLKK